MKMLAAAVTGLVLVVPSSVCADDEATLRIVIQSFYRSFDEGFTGPINSLRTIGTISIPTADALGAVMQP
jgi:hypothetical protein